MSTNPPINIHDLKERNNIYYKINSNEPYSGPLKPDHDSRYLPIYDGSITDGLFSGIISRTNCALPYETNIKDGKKNGLDSHWFRDGSRRSVVNYSDDEKHGSETYWWEDGQMEYEGNYSAGKKHGQETRWYKDGQKKSEENYKDGKKHGLQTKWDKYGRKLSEENYKDGKKHGLEKIFHPLPKPAITKALGLGHQKSEVIYKDGKKDGLETQWHHNGQRESETNYKDGATTKSTEWNDDGKLTNTEHYIDGKAAVYFHHKYPAQLTDHGLENIRTLIDNKIISINITDHSPGAINEFINFFSNETPIDYISQVIGEHKDEAIVSAYDKEKHKEFISQIDAKYPNQ